jgi:hypothetical protein
LARWHTKQSPSLTLAFVSVNETTSQNLWPRINSLMFFFLRRQPRNFDLVSVLFFAASAAKFLKLHISIFRDSISGFLGRYF